MSQDLGLSQIVDIPTRGTSILDLFFTNNPDFVKNFDIIDGLGDHNIVHVKTALQPFRKKPVKRTIQLWTKVDDVKIKKETQDLRQTFLERFSPLDNPIVIWNFLKKEFMKIIKNNVPSKITSSKTHQPWITSETKKLKGTKGLRLQIQIEMLKFIGKSKVKHSGYAGASMTNM